MLAHLRQHLAAALAADHSATLTTSGPAGLQALHVICAAAGLRLLLLVPPTADVLLNLETESLAIVTSARWQAWGCARVLGEAERLAALDTLAIPDAVWHAVVEVRPTRVAIAHPEGWGAAETFDVDEGAP